MDELIIDIANNQAPGQQDINTRQARLQTLYEAGAFKAKLFKRGAIIATIIAGVSLFSLLGLTLLVVEHPETAETLAHLLLSYTFIFVVLAFVGVFVGDDIGIGAGEWRKQLNQLESASSGKCVDIQKWLVNPEIAAYRDTVVSQGRRFVCAEVAAMKQYFDKFEQKKIEAEACQDVYLTGLTH